MLFEVYKTRLNIWNPTCTYFGNYPYLFIIWRCCSLDGYLRIVTFTSAVLVVILFTCVLMNAKFNNLKFSVIVRN